MVLRFRLKSVSRPADPDFYEALFRQRERTIDNIKRVYAVVYSVSFALLLRDIFDLGYPFNRS